MSKHTIINQALCITEMPQPTNYNLQTRGNMLVWDSPQQILHSHHSFSKLFSFIKQVSLFALDLAISIGQHPTTMQHNAVHMKTTYIQADFKPIHSFAIQFTRLIWS